MTFLLEMRISQLEGMSELAIAWRTSTLYHTRFRQAERSSKPCLTAPSVLHRLPSFQSILSARMAQTSAFICKAAVCRLTLTAFRSNYVIGEIHAEYCDDRVLEHFDL
jgi:hypothetical protein